MAVGIELPVLVAVATKPIVAAVVPLISEAHSDAVFAKSSNLFDQSIIELAVPFASEERDDCLTTYNKLRAISPHAVGRISECDARRIASVPRVFRPAHLLDRRVEGERGQGWSLLGHTHAF